MGERAGSGTSVEADLRFEDDDTSDDDDDSVSEGSDDFNAYLGHLDEHMTVGGGDNATPTQKHGEGSFPGAASTPTGTTGTTSHSPEAQRGAPIVHVHSPSTPTPVRSGDTMAVGDALMQTPHRPATTAGLRHSCVKRTPLSALVSTPLRGPLVEKVELLRKSCIERLGEAKFLRAIAVLSSNEHDIADGVLTAELGAETYHASKTMLWNAVMCEQALHNLNEIGKPKYLGC